MTLSLNLSGLGSWELVYHQKTVGDGQGRRFGNPFIDPIEIPVLTSQTIFLVGAAYVKAKPSWSRAGWFYQSVNGVNINEAVIFEGMGSLPISSVDTARHLIRLNTIQLVVFEKLADTHSLRFEPFPWIPEITLGVWEYVGAESDTTDDLINAVRVKLETIDLKIDNLRA